MTGSERQSAREAEKLSMQPELKPTPPSRQVKRQVVRVMKRKAGK